MIECGAFDPRRERRIELIYGELREMSPPGPTHEDLVDWLARWSMENTKKEEVRVRVQNSIGLPELDSAPQPDIAWVKPKNYRDALPAGRRCAIGHRDLQQQPGLRSARESPIVCRGRHTGLLDRQCPVLARGRLSRAGRVKLFSPSRGMTRQPAFRRWRFPKSSFRCRSCFTFECSRQSRNFPLLENKSCPAE